MLNNIIRLVTAKSIGSDLVKMAMKKNSHDDAIREKLGVSTIDEFMKMGIREYENKKGL